MENLEKIIKDIENASASVGFISVEKIKVWLQELKEIKPDIKVNEDGTCGTCGQNIISYKLRFTAMHLSILYKIFTFCVKNKKYLFHKKEMLNLTHTDYGNLYVLQRFGLLYYTKDIEGKRIKDGTWGVPMKRVAGFLNGGLFISEFYERKEGKNIPSESKIRVFDIKKGEKYFIPGEHKPLFVEYENIFNS